MIGSVVEKGNVITVYGEDGREIQHLYIDSGDRLQGYTSTTFSVLRNNGKTIYTYGENCREISHRHL